MKVIRHRLSGSVEKNMDKMANIISKQLRNGIASLEIRELAEDIIKDVPERDRMGEIKAVHEWLSKHKRFTRDPYSIELMESPRRLAREYHKRGTVMADCESIATLEASLLGSLGFSTRVKIVDANPLSKDFSHAYSQVRHAGEWINLDASKNGKIGWAASHTREYIIESGGG